MRSFWVYILAGESAALYTGVTNDIERRVHQHKVKLVPGFTSKYNISRLVHYECFGSATAAIVREKQIKGWSRAKKSALIEIANPTWRDLSEDWHRS